MTYEEQLKDQRWLDKRQIIIDRSWGMCERCMSSKNLNVHHRYYLKGKMAWQYPNSALVTLCNTCHKDEHGIYNGEDEDTIPRLFKKIYEGVNAWIGLGINEMNRKNG